MLSRLAESLWRILGNHRNEVEPQGTTGTLQSRKRQRCEEEEAASPLGPEVPLHAASARNDTWKDSRTNEPSRRLSFVEVPDDDDDVDDTPLPQRLGDRTSRTYFSVEEDQRQDGTCNEWLASAALPNRHSARHRFSRDRPGDAKSSKRHVFSQSNHAARSSGARAAAARSSREALLRISRVLRSGSRDSTNRSYTNLDEDDSDDDVVGPIYVVDDQLTVANLFSQLVPPDSVADGTASNGVRSRIGGVASAATVTSTSPMPSRSEDDAARLAIVRAVYDALVLETVSDAVRRSSTKYVADTEAAIGSLIRSLALPWITKRCPRPKGVLAHIRRSAVVSLPMELDAQDDAKLRDLFPPPPIPPAMEFTSSVVGAVAAIGSSVRSALSRVWSGPSPSSPSASVQEQQPTGDDLVFVVDDEGFQIRRYQLRTLTGKRWLNDQVINYYFHLLAKQFPDCTTLGSHLYAKLESGDMAGALRWVRRKNIFESRVVLVAINMSNSHWTLAVVDHERKCLTYYDSLQGESHIFTLDKVAAFMDAAYAAKHNGAMPPVSYRTWPRNTDDSRRAEYYDVLPRQRNGFDCGVFVTQFGLCAASGIAPDFTQDDVTMLRSVIALELSEGKLLRRIRR